MTAGNSNANRRDFKLIKDYPSTFDVGYPTPKAGSIWYKHLAWDMYMSDGDYNDENGKLYDRFSFPAWFVENTPELFEEVLSNKEINRKQEWEKDFIGAISSVITEWEGNNPRALQEMINSIVQNFTGK